MFKEEYEGFAPVGFGDSIGSQAVRKSVKSTGFKKFQKGIDKFWKCRYNERIQRHERHFLY